MSYQAVIFNLLRRLSGTDNMLTVPRMFCEVTGSLDGGMFLSQLLYWSDKGSDPDGWFYKTYGEWYEDAFLSEYNVRRHTKAFVELGWLETKLKRANGSPTLHYKIDQVAFPEWILEISRIEGVKIKIPVRKIQRSITETTTETTADDDDALALSVSEDRRDVRSGRADQAGMAALRRYAQENIKAATGEEWDDLDQWLGESSFDRLRSVLLWCEAHRDRIMKDPDAIRDPVGFIRAGAQGGKVPGLHPSQVTSIDTTIALILEIVSESEYTQ